MASARDIATCSARARAAIRGATRAHADIKGEGITGRAELVERKNGTGTVVDLTVTASGLKPGMHGVHLHAVGKCEPDFLAAGGHFDPGPASNTDPDANHPFHMGDVPNLEVGADGTVAVPRGAGIGVEIDEAFLDEITVDRQLFRA